MVDKRITSKPENPETKPVNRRPESLPSMDSRHGHGLTKDEALKGKD